MLKVLVESKHKKFIKREAKIGGVSEAEVVRAILDNVVK